MRTIIKVVILALIGALVASGLNAAKNAAFAEAKPRVQAIGVITLDRSHTCYETIRAPWRRCPNGSATLNRHSLLTFNVRPSDISVLKIHRDRRGNYLSASNTRQHSNEQWLWWTRRGKEVAAFHRASGDLFAYGQAHIYWWWG